MTHTNGFTDDLIYRANTWLGKHVRYGEHGEAEEVLPWLWDRRVNDWHRANEEDKATYEAALAGILLALVRKALNLPFAYVAYKPSIQRFAVCDPETGCAVDGVKFDSISEAEALVVALEVRTGGSGAQA